METNSIENVIDMLENMHYPCGPVYRGIERQKAFLLVDNNEIEAIYHLSESHASGLRCNAAFQYDKIFNSDASKVKLVNKQYLEFSCYDKYTKNNHVNNMLREISEMPKEWTIIQLTSQFNIHEMNINDDKMYTNPLHISVFNCGMPQCEPFCITVDAPKCVVDGKNVEVCEEMSSIIQRNRDILGSVTTSKHFSSCRDKKAYKDARENLNCRLKSLVKDIQDIWLNTWRCLFIGKYTAEDVENELIYKVREFLNKENLRPTQKIRHIFHCLVKGCGYLTLNELKQGIQYCFPKSTKSVQVTIFNFIRTCNDDLNLHEIQRQPVILIIDEKLDFLPWEMIDVNRNHPISRMPSLKFTYALFKEHENTIEKGIKVGINYKNGGYIINPNSDLKSMQIRLHSFIKYWTDWNGVAGTKPSEAEFEEMLTKRDILSYSGHGSGSQYLSGDKIQKTRVQAVVLLFGCASVELSSVGPQVEMLGQHNMYLIGCSPCVVGMLWTVTDIDTDLITTEFLSQLIPSTAPIQWKNVDKVQWQLGEIVESKKATDTSFTRENELLRALCKARKAATNYITGAACVARGLPVKISST